MNYEEANEHIQGLKNLIPLVKDFNVTTFNKAFHYTQVENMQKLLYKCAEVHSIYEPEYNYAFQNYKKAVEIQKPKKELDHLLNRCKESLGNDICRHITELENLKDEILQGIA
jgi:hypothetical protein